MLGGDAVERRHNNDNYYYKFGQDVRASPKFDVNAAPCGINVGLPSSRDLFSQRFSAKIFRFSELIRTQLGFRNNGGYSLSKVHTERVRRKRAKIRLSHDIFNVPVIRDFNGRAIKKSTPQ